MCYNGRSPSGIVALKNFQSDQIQNGGIQMKRRKWKQRGNEYARSHAMNYRSRLKLIDVLEQQLAESNKEKRIDTKTLTNK